MIDFHSHVLPNIDDGSSSVEESVSMLVSSKKQGIDVMLATPHFYIERRTLESFCERRTEAFERLHRAIEGRKDVPKIILGAEVRYFNGISNFEQLEKLCIKGTRCMLLEMPFSVWGKRMLRDVEMIIQRGIIPVIAHIERYIKIQKGTDNILSLVGMDVIVQMNFEHIIDFFSRREAFKLISNNVVTLLGTDAHNMTFRKPNAGKGIELLKKKFGDEIIDKFTRRASKILKDAQYEYDY